MTANDGGYFDRVGRGSMGPIGDAALASDLLTRLEDLEAEREGVTVREVRYSLARRLQVSFATLSNIRRKRRKNIPAWLMEAFQRGLIAALQYKVRSLEHDIEITRRIGVGLGECEFIAAQTALRDAKKLLEGAVSRG